MDRVDESHLRGALHNFGKLSFVFVLEDMEIALGQLRRHIPQLTSIGIENTARISETVELADGKIHQFYRSLITYDQTLYDAVRSRSRQFLATASPP
jgi:hypothetical protein